MRRRILLVLTCAVSCAPAAPTPRTIAPPRATGANVKSPQVEHPSRWSLARDDRWTARARIALATGETLWVGEGSERWLVGADGKNPRPAARLVAGSFVGVARTDTGFSFVDDQGRIHETKQPLDALGSVRAPPRPARIAAMGKKAMFVVTQDNDLLRSTDLGATWARVGLPPFEGAKVDLAFSMQGFGILLAMPERILKTEDDGVTWSFAGAKLGAHRLDVTESHGPVVIDSAKEETYYDWSTDPEKQPTHPFEGTDAPKVHKTVLAGTRRFEIVSPDEEQWSFASAELGTPTSHVRRKLLDGCRFVSFGVHEQAIEIACVVPAKNTTHELRLFRSEDLGASFAADGVFPWSSDFVSLFVGPHGFLHLEGNECQGPRLTYGDPCDPTWVRPSTGHPLVELPDRDKLRFLGERMIARGDEVLALALSFDSGALELHRMPLDGSAPERLGTIGPSDGWLYYLRLASTEDGAIWVATRGQQGIQVRRSTDGGHTFVSGARLKGARNIELAGRRALAVGDDDRAFESADGGLHFTRVGYPAHAELLGCSAFGCATTRGDRVGWDLDSGSASTATPAPQVGHAAPMRCTSSGPFAPEMKGNPPLPFAIDPVPGVRWAVPVRGGDSSIRLSIARVQEKGLQLVEVPLLGAASTDPAKRTQTFALSQPLGVIAVRYTYLRKKGGGPLSPVDVELAWHRWSTGKVQHASLPGIEGFRVSHDPRSIGDEAAAWPEERPIVSLATNGLWFSPLDRKLHFASDSGKTELFDDKTAFDSHVFVVERVGKNLALVQVESEDGDVRVLFTKGYWRPQLWTLFRPDDGSIRIFPVEVGGLPGLQATWSGSSRIPAATWTIALEDKSTPELVHELANDKTMIDPPLPCDAALLAKGARRIQPWTMGSRRPIVLSIDGVEHVLASNVAIVRSDKSASCTSAIHGVETSAANVEHEIVVAPHDLAHGTLFRVDRKTWPSKLETRPMTCTIAPGPLPKALEDVDGFGTPCCE